MKDGSGQSLSAFTAVVVFALFLVVGLVVDGGAQLVAAGRAESVAAQTVRVAADAAANAEVGGESPAVAAQRAAGEFLRGESGMSGSATVNADGTISVRVRTSVPTVFLSLIGITTLDATGEASGGVRP